MVSINWSGCECGEVIPYTMNKYFKDKIFPSGTKHLILPFSDKLSEVTHCEQGVQNVPVIVPPTWNKNQYHGALSNVWGHAANELKNARNIFVFGYSLPETDSFFRYLFSLGTAGDSRIRRFWVYNPDDSGDVEERYRGLVGAGIAERFKYFEKTFEEGLNDLRNNWDIDL